MNKARNFQGIVYPDSESYSCEEVLASGLDYFESFAYILHDKDLNDKGELKKPHYHWLGKVKTPLKISVVSNRLGVPENAVEFCHSYRQFLRYLIHADNPEKAQYDVDQIQGNFDKRPLLGDVEKALVAQLMDEIINREIRTFKGLAVRAQELNAWPEFRRNYSVLKDLLFESKHQEERDYGNPFS